MKRIIRAARFEKDLKKIRKRKKTKRKIEVVMEALVCGEQLAPHLRQHKLRGKWKGCNECHIEHDWILVWKETANQIEFVRTGSHNDIFRH